jgi:SAM-dependent methyltransferase
MNDSTLPDQNLIKQMAGADLSLALDFGRFVREFLGIDAEVSLAANGLVFQLLCLMIWERNDSAMPRPELNGPRAISLVSFFDALFRHVGRANPHMLITRGLSFLNYLNHTPLAEPALDLGCENGLTARLLFQRPFQYGVDISPHWAEGVRYNGMHQQYLVGSADAIPLEDGSIRTVVMNNVLYHVASRTRTLSEVLRCLAPGGSVLFDDLSPFYFDESNRPFVAFLRASGGERFAEEYTRRRNTMYMKDRTISPSEALTAAQYPAFMESLGFTDVRAHYFHSSSLLRKAYNFLDIGFVFGCGAVEPQSPRYIDWIKGQVASEVLRDRELCLIEGGGYVFVTARKPS